MVNRSYLLVAENLAERNKNRLSTTRNSIEQTTDEIFYWIISRLEWSIRNCHPAQTSHSVTIRIAWYNNRVLLEHGNMANYLLDYVKGEEIYIFMKDVANVFNEIGKSDSKGYHFHASCYIPNNMNEIAELTVRMRTN